MKAKDVTRALVAVLSGLALPLLAQEPAASEAPVLELSLNDAVERALKNNVDLAVQKYDPEASQADVTAALGAYDPTLTADLTRFSQTSPGNSALSGGATVGTDATSFDLGLSKLFTSGASFSADFQNRRSTTDNSFALFSPSLQSTLTLNARQPLARGFRIDAPRRALRISRNNREISDLQFRQTVINTVAGVKRLYYDVIFNIDNLEAQRKSLALAKKLLDENQIKVKVGTLAPLDVVAAESEVASREEAVIVAENALREAEDALKAAIFPENDPKTWALQIKPTDRPTAERRAVDVDTAVRTAIDKRTDIAVARKALESDAVALRYARNQVRPAFDVVASYSTTGQGGTLLRDPVTGEPPDPAVRRGYGTVLGDVLGRDFPTWTLGVSVSYPLFNRVAEGNAARSQIAQQQAEAALRRLELLVAAEVRTAARAVETNFKRVESTGAARVLSERRLDAEEKRFNAGMSTNFLVTQAQRDLAVAAVAELRAFADYRKSVIDFDRVQEAGFGGGGGSLTLP